MLHGEHVGGGHGQGQPQAGLQAVADDDGTGHQIAGRNVGHGLGFRQHPVRGAGLRQVAPEDPHQDGPGVGGRGGGDDPAGHADRRAEGPPGQQPPAHLDGRGVVGFGQQFGDVLAVAALRHRPQFGERLVEFGAARCPVGHAGDAQQPGRRPKHAHRGRAHHAQVLGGVVVHPIAEPLQVVDHPHQRTTARSQPDRAEVAAEEVGPQLVHRRHHVGVGGVPFEPVRQGAADAGGVPAQIVVVPGREEEQGGGNADRKGDQPAQQALADRAGGVHAGSTKVSSAARCEAAIVALRTPEKVTATPTANIVATAIQGSGDTRVPSVMSAAPIRPRPA